MSTPPTTAVNLSTPSTSRKPKHVFTQKDEITLLKSLLNNTPNPTLERGYSEAQIKHKISRMKQKYKKQDRSSIRKPHDLEIYLISSKIWAPKATTEKNKAVAESTEIDWSDYPFLMKNASGAFPGSEDLYKQGLKGLGKDVLKGFDDKFKKLEMEDDAIQAKKALLVRKHYQSIREGNN